MGFKANDYSPAVVSTYSPQGKAVQVKTFQIARTDTTASVKAQLPQNATIVDFAIYSPAVSDAGTTATVSIGTSSSATELVTGQTVKSAAGMIRPTTTVNTTFLMTEPVPLTGVDTQIYAKYAETGNASTAGGPFTVFMYYV